MAASTRDFPLGFTDKRRIQGQTAESVATPANYASFAALNTRLLAIGGYFTAAVIKTMTLNDMVYALRVNDDPTGIK